MNLSPPTIDDYDDKPFVYETYVDTIASESVITPHTADKQQQQQQQLQLQKQDQQQPDQTPLIIEERGEPGSGTNVFTVADVFTVAQCDDIVDYLTKHSALWEERDLGYASGNNVECKFLILKKLIKDSIPGAKELDDLIFKRVNAVLTAFRDIRPDFKGIHDDGYTLRRIHGGTKRHVDGVHSNAGGFTKLVRAMSFIAVLNDDYDGGIFNFPAQNLKFKVKKGEVVLFPPYWTHPHSVSSVGEGQARYTINTWIMEDFIGGHTSP